MDQSVSDPRVEEYSHHDEVASANFGQTMHSGGTEITNLDNNVRQTITQIHRQEMQNLKMSRVKHRRTQLESNPIVYVPVNNNRNSKALRNTAIE